LPRGDGAAPALETKTLALEPDATSVRANLKLAKSSAPAVLKVVFRGPDGSALGEVTRTVKQSAASDIAVPQNAASAEFTASKASEEDEVAITGFAPTQARRR
ncbi:MAG: hypothetical protein IJI73_10270, partial [Kiritimatiellae bacterium]|nr:hypothetical protein [Kiritimatiellia bacterium]